MGNKYMETTPTFDIYIDTLPDFVRYNEVTLPAGQTPIIIRVSAQYDGVELGASHLSGFTLEDYLSLLTTDARPLYIQMREAAISQAREAVEAMRDEILQLEVSR